MPRRLPAIPGVTPPITAIPGVAPPIPAVLASLLLTACHGSTHVDSGVSPDTSAIVEAEPADTTSPDTSAAPTLFEDAEGRYGYRDAQGQVVIPATFMMASEFTGQVAAAVADEGWVFIDRQGKPIARAFVVDNFADEFVEDRARIVEGERYGFLDSAGTIVIAPTWSFVEAFAGGRAAVCQGCVRQQEGEVFRMVGGSWGYVDLRGELVIPPRFESAGPFVEGRASVREAGRSFDIDPAGLELP